MPDYNKDSKINENAANTFRPGGRGMQGMLGPKVKPKNTKGTLKRLWVYLSKQKSKLYLVFLFVLLSSAFSLTGPYLTGKAIDKYIVNKDFNGLFNICAIMLIFYGMSSFITWMQNFIMIGISQDSVLALRNDVFSKLQTLPLKFFDSRPHGDIMSRVSNDIDNISNTLNSSVTQLFADFIMVFGTICMMVYLSPILTLFSLIIIPIMTIVTKKIAANTRKYYVAQQKNLGALNGIIEETISGQRVVKVFNRESNIMKKFDKANIELKRVGIRAQIFSGIIPPLMNVLNNLSFAIIASVGGYLAVENIITVGVIASFITYSKQFTRPLNDIANQFNLLQSAVAGAERVFEIMDEDMEMVDMPNAIELTNIKGEVSFKDMSFSYDKKVPVLKDINIDVKEGQTIALVGPTGAGKTTIVNLLTRFYDIDRGAIYIDGNDIRSLKRDSLRKNLGIVLQDTHLFSISVRENIRFGRLAATDKEVEEAARLANADHFIRRLSDGYDTILTEDGGNLSQGQRQLLSIARAILSDPAILILDEATSSVDTRTEIHIQEAMLNLMKGRTSFVIAHRLSTIRGADMILVINNGEIIEKGTHEELLNKQGFYYNLYKNQLRRKVS